jgi:basic membrane protein A
MKIKFLALMVALIVLAVAPVSADTMRVGVVLSIGGLGDESFNDAAYQGIMQLRKEGDCIVEVVEPGSISGIEPALRYFCERNMDMVCAVGIFANDAVRRIAAAFPESRLVLIDSVVTMPNVLSILFDEEQGSFYAGAFAALASRSNVLRLSWWHGITGNRKFRTWFYQWR